MKIPKNRRPDDSMSLLNDLFEEPLEPGYEEAARRSRAPGQPLTPKRKFSFALMVGTLALGLLLMTAVLQVRNSAAVVSTEREELVQRIKDQDSEVATLQDNVSSLRAQIDDLEDTFLQDSAAGQELRSNLESLRANAGQAAVSGPGVVVTVDDAPDNENVQDPELAKVLDLDLRQVVNGLWAAGAEAVSVNGQRITALTAIRSADNVIKVNYRPLDAPFEVRAVGDSRTLPEKFGEGMGGQWLQAASQQTGLEFTIRAAESLTVPASPTSLHYAQPKEEM